MENITGILLLATLVEGFTEYIFGKFESKQVKFAIPYIALVFGIGAAFAYKVDILGMFGLEAHRYVAYVASGLILGRGSNFLNDVISWVRVKSSPTTLNNPIMNQPTIAVTEVPE